MASFLSESDNPRGINGAVTTTSGSDTPSVFSLGEKGAYFLSKAVSLSR